MRPRITYLAALAPEEPQPNVEETFAGALALMTAHAEAADGERAAIASAVSAHLVRIASVACTSAECRLALAVLAAHWAAISEDGVDVPQDVLLWHVAPAAVQ